MHILIILNTRHTLTMASCTGVWSLHDIAITNISDSGGGFVYCAIVLQ